MAAAVEVGDGDEMMGVFEPASTALFFVGAYGYALVLDALAPLGRR